MYRATIVEVYPVRPRKRAEADGQMKGAAEGWRGFAVD